MNWKIRLIGLILCSLTALGVCFSEELAELRQYLAEAKMENEALTEQNHELQAKLDAADDELAELRSRYAEIVMRIDQEAENLAQMELAASNLVRGEDDSSERLQLLEAVGTVRKAVILLDGQIRGCADTVSAMMDACQPSEALRGQCEAKFVQLKATLQECLRNLPGAEAAAPNEAVACSIVKVDSAAGLIIIDQGSAAGLRPGAQLELKSGDAVLAIVKVVVCRLDAAAAMLTEGDFKALVPGLLMRRVDGQSRQ